MRIPLLTQVLESTLNYLTRQSTEYSGLHPRRIFFKFNFRHILRFLTILCCKQESSLGIPGFEQFFRFSENLLLYITSFPKLEQLVVANISSEHSLSSWKWIIEIEFYVQFFCFVFRIVRRIVRSTFLYKLKCLVTNKYSCGR